jgi:hypothetical protein
MFAESQFLFAILPFSFGFGEIALLGLVVVFFLSPSLLSE